MKFIDWFIGASLDKANDSYEKARIKMNFHVWSAFTITLTLLIILLIYFGDKVGLIYPIGLGLVLAAITGVMIKNGRSKMASYLITIFGWGIVVTSIFTIINPLPVDGGVWLALFIVYAFFMHGKKTGTILMIVSVILYSLFIIFRLADNLVVYNKETIAERQYFVVATIVAVIFIMMRSVIAAFIDARDEVNQQLQQKMDELSHQYSIIESQNKEKTVMMNEIHHRVKNNLQVINSLLRIQSSKLDDKKTIDVFNEAQSRVIAMSLIHEEMYRNEKLDQIGFANYIQSLSKEILENLESQKKVDLNVNSELDFIDNKTIVPLGLIMNELIMNSVKHGFQNTTGNKITIDFKNEKEFDGMEGAFMMNYTDNGVGFDPKKVDPDKSFGLELIYALSEQLNAQFEIHPSDQGVCLSLSRN